MSSWRRWVIGDAFEVHSIQFYRDFFLVFPALWFSILFGTVLTTSPHTAQNSQIMIRSGLCVALAIFLAGERVMLIAVILMSIGARLGLLALFLLNWRYGLVAAVLLASLWILVRQNRERLSNPSYRFPRELHLLDLLVGGAGFAVTLLVLHYWIAA
jgi:hypothetical protein